jgi:hypothetical protein
VQWKSDILKVKENVGKDEVLLKLPFVPTGDEEFKHSAKFAGQPYKLRIMSRLILENLTDTQEVSRFVKCLPSV